MPRSYLIALALAASCVRPAQITVLRATPVEYEPLWQRVTQCTGVQATLDSTVRAVVVWHDAQFQRSHVLDKDAGAFYDSDSKELWILARNTKNKQVILHELLHAALRTRGINGHPSEFFGPKCGITKDYAGAR